MKHDASLLVEFRHGCLHICRQRGSREDKIKLGHVLKVIGQLFGVSGRFLRQSRQDSLDFLFFL